MDIGVAYRDLGQLDIYKAAQFVQNLPESAWQANRFRQEMLADKVHDMTRALLFRHEWTRWNNPWRVRDLETLLRNWAEREGIDAAPLMPKNVAETDIGPIYEFPDWQNPLYQEIFTPLVAGAIAPLATPGGVITRIAVVMLLPGGKIAPHIDGQPMAAKAHRLHVPILCPPNVDYKIGGQKLVMRPGHIYDFNNKWRHSVRHAGKMPRVNLFIDYYPDPKPAIAPLF
jgi:Aspartyl/Asparaginyl beta-hydroxylase